ncbi:putative mitochondrial protein AtMg00310 [Castanea sativa]|uniref:putative mitochondrial protein AtMg00310 n=1 Tax=Castanea sativa TaxID=21020 RepID=UPI003F651539
MEDGMGFWNLRNFNLAMLAKQGWRMIQGNDSLLYKCFKGRYFPRSSFLDAKESLGCSYVWRSLLAALPILRSGYCWRVGNGSSISVLGDKWIPNHPTNKVLHPINELADEMAVSELIDSKLHVWRSGTIMSLFHKEDADAITKIPLSRRVVPDSIS